MPVIVFEEQSYAVAEGESVLECLERHGHAVPSSCRSGVCHSCMMRGIEGELPAASQQGVGEARQRQAYFLSCCCYPTSELRIARAEDAVLRTPATLVARETLSHRVLRVTLAPSTTLAYYPGQFVNFVRGEGLVRSFSLASVPTLDEYLEFHVALVEGGRMSGWLHHEACPGDKLDLLGPLGNCFYVPGSSEQPLLLLGTGTGLAPLYAIARDALHQGHSGPIHLFHGSLVAQDLYLTDELRALDADWSNFSYHACVRDEACDNWITRGAVDAIALETVPKLTGWKVFLCGHPDLVRPMQRKAFLAGARMQDIHADAFLPAASPTLRQV